MDDSSLSAANPQHDFRSQMPDLPDPEWGRWWGFFFCFALIGACMRGAYFQICIVIAPGPFSHACFWVYIGQTRCYSSLERTAYGLGTQPTTLCRWSSMATETPKWVKDLCSHGCWMWHIRDIFEWIPLWWSWASLLSHYIHRDLKRECTSSLGNMFTRSAGKKGAENLNKSNYSQPHSLSVLSFSRTTLLWKAACPHVHVFCFRFATSLLFSLAMNRIHQNV